MELLPPLFVQVFITFLMAFCTGGSRFIASRSGQVKIKDIALRQPNWPEQATKFGNAFQNQLETPILFYLLIVLLLLTKLSDHIFLVLAWVYIALRIVHLVIHVTNNNVLHRFMAFAASIIILSIMWVRFILAVYS